MLQKHCHAPLACGAAPTGHDGLSVCDDGAEWAMCGEGANHCCCVGVCDDVVPTPAPTGSDLCHDKPIDMAFVIDSSDSIEPIDFETVKHAVGDIITGLEIAPTKIQIAAHAFSCLSCHEHPEAGFGLTEHYGAARVALAIDALPHHMSSTYMGTAMEHTIEKVMTPSAGLRNTGNPPVIIIITDGNPTGRQGVVAAEQAAAARAAGFKIFAIGVGGKANDAQLQAMASTPYEDHVYQLDTFDVSVFKNQLLDTVCSQASTTSAVAALPTALQGRENQL